jgi:flagellar motility protein MotE (MotC chaperone)
MIGFFRDVRLVPIVLVAVSALFVLKTTGLITSGGYTLGAGHLARSDRLAQEAAERAANKQLHDQQVGKVIVAGRPLAQAIHPDVTGSVGSTKSKEGEKADAKADPKTAAKTDAKAEAKAESKADANKKAEPIDPKPAPDGTVIPLETKPISPAERAILQRLSERRLELDEIARELQVRETLLQAKEKRVEEKVRELKEVESKIVAATKKKEEMEDARLKGLVTMYETMKAKDAARIFERLDIGLATEVAQQISPRRMSEIMAQMSPQAAERLTVELANRSAEKKPAPAELPKIEGRPSGS